jgi:hypothetical protein
VACEALVGKIDDDAGTVEALAELEMDLRR